MSNKAGCIISGAIKGTSSNVLFEQLFWMSMETCRKHHKIYAFHSISIFLSPAYLRNCLPSYVRDISSYQLRDADALRTVLGKLDLFYNPFSSGGLWVELVSTQNENDSLSRKKQIALHKSLPVSNKLYHHGKWKCSIIHSRLCMGCSELNVHPCL